MVGIGSELLFVVSEHVARGVEALDGFGARRLGALVRRVWVLVAILGVVEGPIHGSALALGDVGEASWGIVVVESSSGIWHVRRFEG